MRTAIKNKYKKATSTPKGKIIFFTLLFLIIGAIGGAIVYWTFYKKQIIREQLEMAIRNKSQGLYSVHYDNLSLDEVEGDLTVTNFTLNYDSSKYLQLRDQATSPPTLLRITIPAINVSGVKTPRALLDKEIVGKKLQIINPLIQITYTYAGKDSLKNAPTKEVYEQILGQLNLIKVDTVVISNATITTLDIRTGLKKVELLNTNIQLLDVAVDSASEKDDSRLLFAKAIDINAANIKWRSVDKRYDYSIDSVELNSTANAVHVGAFKIIPLMSEAGFTKTQRYADDRFDFTLKDIRIKNFDFKQLFSEELVADTVAVRSASIKIYRDISLPHDRKNRVGTYPSQAILKAPIPIDIKAVVLNNTYVEYRERNPKTSKTGKVQFSNTTATLTNVTNRTELIKENNIMVVDARTYFMSKVPLHATWKFFLNSPNGRFNLSGNMAEVNAVDANVLTEPMGPARIEKGIIHSLQFNFTANDYGMKGTVKMLYDDLKIAVLEKDKDSKEIKKKKLASLAANVLVKNSNPSGKKDEPRVIDVDFKRDVNRSMFHMIWKSIFKGMKESVGINK